MNATEFNEILSSLRLSGAGLHRLTGASLSSITRYRNGKPIPPALTQLLRMYAKLGELMAELEAARKPAKAKRRR